MKITVKLTILFTIITAGIVFLFAAVIYNYAKLDREEKFYDRIKIKALVKGELFFDAKASTKVLQDIHSNNLKVMNEAEIAVYNTNFKLLFHDDPKSDIIKETPAFLKKVLHKGEVKFYQGAWQAIGIRYSFKGKYYIITAISYDHYGYNKIDNMYQHMVYAYCVAIIVICFSGLFFSVRAFAPVKSITQKVNKITASRLDVRLQPNNNKDELSQLAITFNEMLDRLQNSFDSQKSFVSNISHELRTPLAAIITELELSLAKENSVKQYKEAVQYALNDAKRLSRLSTSLLDLARAGYDKSEISFKELRIDELLLDVVQAEQQINRSSHVDIIFDDETQEDLNLTISGNEYLLKVVFGNLLNNACKYSPNNYCRLNISGTKNNLTISFTNSGPGIAKDEQQAVFQPFFRGANRTVASGSGIGLSLSQKIVLLHNGTISLKSDDFTTTFAVVLPTLLF